MWYVSMQILKTFIKKAKLFLPIMISMLFCIHMFKILLSYAFHTFGLDVFIRFMWSNSIFTIFRIASLCMGFSEKNCLVALSHLQNFTKLLSCSISFTKFYINSYLIERWSRLLFICFLWISLGSWICRSSFYNFRVDKSRLLLHSITKFDSQNSYCKNKQWHKLPIDIAR